MKTVRFSLGMVATSVLLLAFLDNEVSAQTVLSARESNAQGFTKDGTTIPYSYLGTPLLKQFFLKYTSKDHHIRRIQIRPVGQQLDVSFRDKNGDDEFFYNVGHLGVSGSGVRNREKSGFSRGGTEVIPLTDKPDPDSVFVLRGFDIQYTSKDHHLDMLWVYENNGRLIVGFNDKNNDDDFEYKVYFTWVPKRYVVTSGAIADKNVRAADSATIPHGVSVISGFRFDFCSDDHHLRDVGVVAKDGKIEVYYEDKNGDDRFDWTVKYAVLRTQGLARTGLSLGTTPVVATKKK